MFLYSSLLALALAVSAPWWLWRMATSNRYRAGLRDRLGILPASLDEVITKRGAAAGLIWVHAVSVGEVLAAERLIHELPTAFPGYQIVVSTTTATGNAIAIQKLGVPVFYFPLDFAFAVRRYLRALRPTLILLVESELWPRLLHEAKQANIPVAVVNASVSDRSFRRTIPFGKLWLTMASKVALFLTQSDETHKRLAALGVSSTSVVTTGNLKYDTPNAAPNPIASWLKELAAGRPILVAGSTLASTRDDELDEEAMLVQAWEGRLRRDLKTLLVLAPRHPERFGEVEAMAMEFQLQAARNPTKDSKYTEVVVLNTLGDLAAVYGVADTAFIGGSLVQRGGHNPLEAARFGVPVIMGPSYQNFREIVEGLVAAEAIAIVPDRHHLESAIFDTLRSGQTQGQRGKEFFESQAGATARTLIALQDLLK